MGSKLEVDSSARSACLPLAPRGEVPTQLVPSAPTVCCGMRCWAVPASGLCSSVPSSRSSLPQRPRGKQGWLGSSLLNGFGQQERGVYVEQSRRGVLPLASWAPPGRPLGGLLLRPPVASCASGDSNQAASSRRLSGLMDTQCLAHSRSLMDVLPASIGDGESPGRRRGRAQSQRTREERPPSRRGRSLSVQLVPQGIGSPAGTMTALSLSLPCAWLPAGTGAERYELMLMETLEPGPSPLCAHTRQTLGPFCPCQWGGGPAQSG